MGPTLNAAILAVGDSCDEGIITLDNWIERGAVLEAVCLLHIDDTMHSMLTGIGEKLDTFDKKLFPILGFLPLPNNKTSNRNYEEVIELKVIQYNKEKPKVKKQPKIRKQPKQAEIKQQPSRNLSDGNQLRQSKFSRSWK